MSYGHSEREKDKAPCKGCTERFSGCHSKCERYNTWIAEVRNKKFLQRQSIDPTGCGYFKERHYSQIAKVSKRRYR